MNQSITNTLITLLATSCMWLMASCTQQNGPMGIGSQEGKSKVEMASAMLNSSLAQQDFERVLLLAVSCRQGGLCPGGLDLENPSNWIRIVKDDGQAGAVQGREIDFAEPLDVIEFEGKPMPQGKQRENWVILNNSCRKVESKDKSILEWAYQQYSYHGFWGNYKSYLDEYEFANVTEPSESILNEMDFYDRPKLL